MRGWGVRVLGGHDRLAVVRALPLGGPWLLGLSIAVTLVSVAVPMGITVATGAVTGALPGVIGAGWDSDEGRHLVRVLMVMGGLYVLDQVLGPVRQLVTAALGRRVSGRLRERVLTAALSPVGIGHLEDPATLDQVTMAREIGVSGFTPGMAATSLFGFILFRLIGLGQAVIVATWNPLVAVLLVVAALAARTPMRNQILKTVDVVIGRARALRRAEYFRDMAITPAAAKETRIFGLGGWVLDRFRTTSTSAMEAVWAERRGGQIRLVYPLLFQAGANVLALWLLTEAAFDGDLSLARFAVLVQATMGVRAINNISNDDLNLMHGGAGVPAVDRLEEAAAAPALHVGGDEPADGLPARSIRFEHVSFRYPGTELDIYKGLDLELRAGESTAIVGANGAGKTTLVKLLTRLYDPTEGRITADGIDLRDLDPRGWQRRVAAIFQDFLRYELSAAENIGLGDPDHLGDRNRLIDAARRAGALEIVEDLPKGWDTVLSRRYEDGVDLSGGQWQRIALARALFAVRGGAGVLVLDEPTAALDVRAEAELFDRFLDLTAGLTTVLISHRFSTVRRADRIVVIEHGAVIEDGSHAQLVKAAGRYAELFRLQSERFNGESANGRSEGVKA